MKLLDERLVKSGDWVDYGFGMGQPDLLRRARSPPARDELRDVRIRSCLTLRPRAVLEADPQGPSTSSWFNWHFSGYDRRQHDAGRCDYIPMNFGEAPDYYRRFLDPVDVVCVKTCPMDARRLLQLRRRRRPTCKALAERARKVLVVETSPRMPYVFGARERRARRARSTTSIEGSAEPVPEIAQPGAERESTAPSRALIVAEIADGACLQIGIGGMPNAVCARAEGNRREATSASTPRC